MTTLVVYESMWGDARTVADAVASGIGGDVDVVAVSEAPVPVPAEVELLVVGGPRTPSRCPGRQRGAMRSPRGTPSPTRSAACGSG